MFSFYIMCRDEFFTFLHVLFSVLLVTAYMIVSRCFHLYRPLPHILSGGPTEGLLLQVLEVSSLNTGSVVVDNKIKAQNSRYDHDWR